MKWASSYVHFRRMIAGDHAYRVHAQRLVDDGIRIGQLPQQRRVLIQHPKCRFQVLTKNTLVLLSKLLPSLGECLEEHVHVLRRLIGP